MAKSKGPIEKTVTTTQTTKSKGQKSTTTTKSKYDNKKWYKQLADNKLRKMQAKQKFQLEKLKIKAGQGKAVGIAKEVSKTSSTLGGYSVINNAQDRNKSNKAAEELAAWLNTTPKADGSNQIGNTSDIDSSALGG